LRGKNSNPQQRTAVLSRSLGSANITSKISDEAIMRELVRVEDQNMYIEVVSLFIASIQSTRCTGSDDVQYPQYNTTDLFPIVVLWNCNSLQCETPSRNPNALLVAPKTPSRC
jgi:hypothetical protein